MSKDFPLSSAGEDRREEILLLAKAQARERRHRRQGWLAGAGVALIVLASLVIPRSGTSVSLRVAIRPNLMPMPPSAKVVTHPDARPPALGQIAITRISTEANIAARLAVPPQKPSWQMLNDDELMRQLAAAGCPAGLAWINGREMILFRHPLAGEHS
jgi:hypothetical protein